MATIPSLIELSYQKLANNLIEQLDALSGPVQEDKDTIVCQESFSTFVSDYKTTNLENEIEHSVNQIVELSKVNQEDNYCFNEKSPKDDQFSSELEATINKIVSLSQDSIGHVNPIPGLVPYNNVQTHSVSSIGHVNPIPGLVPYNNVQSHSSIDRGVLQQFNLITEDSIGHVNPNPGLVPYNNVQTHSVSSIGHVNPIPGLVPYNNVQTHSVSGRTTHSNGDREFLLSHSSEDRGPLFSTFIDDLWDNSLESTSVYSTYNNPREIESVEMEETLNKFVDLSNFPTVNVNEMMALFSTESSIGVGETNSFVNEQEVSNTDSGILSYSNDATRVNDVENKFVCSYCFISFSSSRLCCFHEKQFHGNHIKNLNKMFSCKKCSELFTRKYNLERHEQRESCTRKKKSRKIHTCEICSLEFLHKRNLLRHKKSFHLLEENVVSSTSILCGSCGVLFKNLDNKCPCCKEKTTKTNKKKKPCQTGSGKATNSQKTKCAFFHCHKCVNVFHSKSELYEHHMFQHPQQGGGNLQDKPWEGDENAPWNNNGKIDDKFQQVYEMHAPFILQNHKTTPITSTYNFPVNDVSLKDLKQQITYIFENETRTFKVNVTFGFILKNIETNKLRYFKPYENQNIFQYPFLISKKEHLVDLIKQIEDLNTLKHIMSQREDTKSRVFFITNVLYSVFPYDYHLGGNVELPSFIKRNKSIISFDKDVKGESFNDDLCFFRSLTAHFHPSLFHDRKQTFFKNKVKNYFQKWLDYNSHQGKEITKFTGVKLSEIAQLELCFEVNINIFQLVHISSCMSIFKTLSTFDTTMNLNLYENHLSFIQNVNGYSKKCICSHCKRIFKRKDNWKVHEKKCENKLDLKYVGGYYSPPQSIFEELENYGISVPLSKRFFREFIVFDMESMLLPISEKTSEKLYWTHQHIPISVGICSNVDGFTAPRCIVNENVDMLIQEMVEYFKTIQEKIQAEKLVKFSSEFEQLSKLITEYKEKKEEIQNKEKNGKSKISISPEKIMISQLNSLQNRFEKYCCEVPVLGFNSARYDINLIKAKVLKYLEVHKNKESFIVKKNNSYMCIGNGTFKLLDITHFLSPGTSYEKFLKSFDVKEKKGFFPYEYFTKVSRLQETNLPPIEKWWSSLKNKNMLDDGIHSMEENFKWLQEIWIKEKMETFQDFLVWYNKLDVYPFVTAASRLSEFYFEKNIDVFKEAISVPGVARKLLFKEARKQKVSFSLINNKNKDLHHTITQNIVGGPSIIFKRHHKKEETFIRNNANIPCKSVIGFDANALYLWAFDQTMPAGSYIRRKAKTSFKPEKSSSYEKMFYWMDWLNLTKSCQILHLKNQGKEKRVGPYLVDGYDCSTNTVYQFQGCYFHGHSCHLTKHIHKEKEKKLFKKRKERTSQIKSYIKQKGHKFCEIYECKFDQMNQINKPLKDFISCQKSSFTRRYPGKVSVNTILEGIKTDKLFGMVEVDIVVPNSWDEVSFKPDTKLTPFEYFEEMCPLFGNVDITFDKIGKHMQNFIERNDLCKRPRRLLVGVMKAEQILLATPLLKWYIEHGMKVTRIYQVIEYSKPSPCFSSFVEEVSKARRKGDENSSNSSLAETMKLIGNSAFGSMIMNKTKHKKIYYLEKYEDLSKAINSPKFEKLTEIANDFYEIEAFKKNIMLNLPIQIGFFILQLAKLRMLEFYYDFMDKFVDRSLFEYCEMDTDSAYMAIASEQFEDIIKPSLKQKFEKGLKGFCTNTHPKAKSIFV